MIHGGDLAAARRLFPQAPEPWLDLSTGINAVSYPLPVLPPACFTRLPEPAALAALERAAADAYGVADPGMVVAAPGTQSLIQLLPRLLPETAVAVVAPTYSEHAAGWRAAGHAVHEVPTPEEAADAAVAVLCNPNNPDGRRVTPARLRALAGRLRLLVVDEAFADFESDISLAAAIPPATIVLRSFGKAYGLAGVRLGFALAKADWTARLRAALGPWAVSGPAVSIGIAALADGAWRRAAAERLAQQCVQLDRLLTEAGCQVHGGTALFRLARHDQAAALHARLGRAGVLVRRFDAWPHWLRFGVPGDGAALDRLRRALGP